MKTKWYRIRLWLNAKYVNKQTIKMSNIIAKIALKIVLNEYTVCVYVCVRAETHLHNRKNVCLVSNIFL